MYHISAEIQTIHRNEPDVYDKSKSRVQLFTAKSISFKGDDAGYIVIDTDDGKLQSFTMIPRAIIKKLVDSGLKTGYVDFVKAGIAFKKNVNTANIRLK